MQDNILKQLMQVVDQKFALNTKQYENGKLPELRKWTESESYLDAMHDEIEEVRDELKTDNKVYLEDELWDILWAYLNLLYCLEQEWKADTIKVLERALKKYKQRADWLDQWISWDEIKVWQKQELKKEHNKTYNT